MRHPVARLQMFAYLIAMAGLFCGVPLIAVAATRTGLVTLTGGVGLLLVLIGCAGARILMLVREIQRAEVPVGPAAAAAQ